MSWLAQDAVAIPGAMHDLLKHLEKLLPKFNLDHKESPEDHVKKFMLVVRLMNQYNMKILCASYSLTPSKVNLPLGT